jgi:hypothetical protein
MDRMHITTRFLEFPSRVESVELRDSPWNFDWSHSNSERHRSTKKSDKHFGSNSDPPSEFANADQISFVEYMGS